VPYDLWQIAAAYIRYSARVLLKITRVTGQRGAILAGFQSTIYVESIKIYNNEFREKQMQNEKGILDTLDASQYFFRQAQNKDSLEDLRVALPFYP
jgi:hypothetical protein